MDHSLYVDYYHFKYCKDDKIRSDRKGKKPVLSIYIRFKLSFTSRIRLLLLFGHGYHIPHFDNFEIASGN